MFAKRSTTVLLIFAVMLSLMATVAAGLYGDFDGDGDVTSDDAVYLLRSGRYDLRKTEYSRRRSNQTVI